MNDLAGSDSAGPYKTWNMCSSCGFQGLFVFLPRAGEDYEDPDSLGALMDTQCPACEEEETVLVVIEEYREMVFIAKTRPDG